MFEQALKCVLAQRSLFSLSMYHKDLSERFSKRYFDAYKELLIPFADSEMGRSHYREIVKYLKQMKRIKGFKEEFRKLVKLLKAKYANRPAFLDEIKSIWMKGLFEHMVKLKTRVMLNGVNRLRGYHEIEISSPEEVIELRKSLKN